MKKLIESIFDVDDLKDAPLIRMNLEKYNKEYSRSSEINRPYWEFVVDKSTDWAPCSLESRFLKFIDLDNTTFSNPPKSFERFVNDCKLLKTFRSGSNWDLSELRSMNYMFSNCWKLEDVEFRNWANESNLRTINWLFNGCYQLRNIDLSSFDFSGVELALGMFSDCENLENVNFGDSKWKKLKNIGYMFHNNTTLESIDLSNLINDNPIVFRQTINDPFFQCRSLHRIDGVFDLSLISIHQMNNMFRGCENLREVKLKNLCAHYNSNRDISNAINFRNISNLSPSSIAYLFENIGDGYRKTKLIVPRDWVDAMGGNDKFEKYRETVSKKGWKII